MSTPRILIVGTYASINAWANDQGWTKNIHYHAITSRQDLLGVVNSQIDTVYITYGWHQMPTTKALEIADFLIGAGIDRKTWRYVV